MHPITKYSYTNLQSWPIILIQVYASKSLPTPAVLGHFRCASQINLAGLIGRSCSPNNPTPPFQPSRQQGLYLSWIRIICAGCTLLDLWSYLVQKWDAHTPTPSYPHSTNLSAIWHPPSTSGLIKRSGKHVMTIRWKTPKET